MVPPADCSKVYDETLRQCAARQIHGVGQQTGFCGVGAEMSENHRAAQARDYGFLDP